MSEQTKPTLKELRAEVQRLGITPERVGRQTIQEVVQCARNHEDPMGWLSIYGTPEAMEAVEAEEAAPTETESGDVADGQAEPAEAACELAVDAENEPIEDASASPPAAPRRLPTVKIVVPQADTDLTDCYISGHVDVRMTSRQGVALRRLCLALDAQNVCLANGRRAVTAADAVRWLLEEIGVD